MYEHLLSNHHRDTVRALIEAYGLRPVVDAVGAAALDLLRKGTEVKNEFGEHMTPDDVETAARNLLDGDLY